MPVIYIDVLLALNLFIDFLLLAATARVLRLPIRRWRMVAGALIGAASACLVFLPDPPAPLSLLIKLLSAAAIVAVAFRWNGPAAYIKRITVFFIISTVFAGLAFALWFFAAPAGFYVVNGVVYYDVPPLMLVALTLASYGAMCLYDRFTRKKAPAGGEYRLTVDVGSGPVTLRALYDSGNRLTEPFSGSPVIVVRAGALLTALPDDWRRAVEAAGRGELPAASDAAGGGTATAVRARLRMVPYHSVGGMGMLPAFRPVRVAAVAPGRGERDLTGVFVALCTDLGRGDYDALIGCDVADLCAGHGASIS